MTTLKQILLTYPQLESMTYPQIVDWLKETPLIANPKAHEPISKPITRETIITMIPAAEAWAIYSVAPTLKDDLFSAIDTGSRAWLEYLLGVVQASGKLQPGTLAKLAAELNAKINDPTWKAQIPGPARWELLGLAEEPTAADVQEAANAGA